MSKVKRFLKKSIYFHFITSFLVHLFLIGFCEIQDRISDIKYTDIDYVIFSDGARFVLEGGSPFDRDTYRYTPLLAWMMTPNIFGFFQFGKVLFSLLDILVGWLIYSILPNNVDRKLCALIWLYNPLSLIISTRGSSESVICALVILTIYFLIKKQYFLGGLIFGFVIHFKIFPIIYTPTFYLAMSPKKKTWSKLFPNKLKFIFFISASFGFIIPTVLSYLIYGNIYIEEAWLYHFHRQDFQHNFSPYFYFYHLITDDFHRKVLSLFSFIPQFTLIVIFAFYFLFGPYQRKDLFMSLFVQTFIFVTLNKVITAQYFEWYMCLFPLILPYFDLSLFNWITVFIIWSFSIQQWLLPAYLYEFRKWNCFHWVGYSSIFYVTINLSLLSSLLYLQISFKRKHL